MYILHTNIYGGREREEHTSCTPGRRTMVASKSQIDLRKVLVVGITGAGVRWSDCVQRSDGRTNVYGHSERQRVRQFMAREVEEASSSWRERERRWKKKPRN